MAPEHQARARVLYDHESDEPAGRVPSGNLSGRVAGQRRGAVADWGVGEDIFDRMPSRRFKRSERRAEHRAERPEHRADRTEFRPDRPEHRGDRPEHRAERPESTRFAKRRPAESWGADAWSAAPPRNAPGESRTIVIERAPGGAAEDAETRVLSAADVGEAPAPRAARDARVAEAPASIAAVALDESPARRTVVIKGRPDRLPAARPARPPRTALERVGASPDRIVAYAVALGFLLVLIAVLTTGQ